MDHKRDNEQDRELVEKTMPQDKRTNWREKTPPGKRGDVNSPVRSPNVQASFRIQMLLQTRHNTKQENVNGDMLRLPHSSYYTGWNSSQNAAGVTDRTVGSEYRKDTYREIIGNEQNDRELAI